MSAMLRLSCVSRIGCSGCSDAMSIALGSVPTAPWIGDTYATSSDYRCALPAPRVTMRRGRTNATSGRLGRCPTSTPARPSAPIAWRRSWGAVRPVSVYRASSGAESVALKVLRPELAIDEMYRRRFLREVRIAQELRHPHLVEVLDAGADGGTVYMVARYVHGRSLARVLAEDGPLPMSQVVRTALGVASGLDELHRQGIVHRDVKPSNILIDGEGRAMLTDFGLARHVAETVLTSYGLVLGTLDYIAPERLDGGEATPATDIYSLGCVVYACLTGHAPFAGRSIDRVMDAHRDEEPEDPTSGSLQCALRRSAGPSCERSPRTRHSAPEPRAPTRASSARVRSRATGERGRATSGPCQPTSTVGRSRPARPVTRLRLSYRLAPVAAFLVAAGAALASSSPSVPTYYPGATAAAATSGLAKVVRGARRGLRRQRASGRDHHARGQQWPAGSGDGPGRPPGAVSGGLARRSSEGRRSRSRATW